MFIHVNCDAMGFDRSEIIECDSATLALLPGTSLGCYSINIHFQNGISQNLVAALALNRDKESPSYEFKIYQSNSYFTINEPPLLLIDSRSSVLSSFLNFDGSSRYLVVNDLDQDDQLEVLFVVNNFERGPQLSRLNMFELKFSETQNQSLGLSISYRRETTIDGNNQEFNMMSGVSASISQRDNTAILMLPQARQTLVRENLVRKFFMRYQSNRDNSGASSWERIDGLVIDEPLVRK